MSKTLTFPQQVIALTRAIPKGKVLNYGAIAALLDRPRNARAVGYALNQLPYDNDVPWHRVVGKNGVYGKVSLRSFDHSRDEQIARLKDEGVQFNDNQQFRLINYLWQPSPETVKAALLRAASEISSDTD